MDWRNIARWAAIVFAGIALAVLLAIALGLYTAPGRFLVARLISPLTDGRVVVRGLSGNLPDHLLVDELDLRDSQGTWLHVEKLVLDWKVFPIFSNHLVVLRARAVQANFFRRPIPSDNKPSTFIFDIDKAVIDHATVASAVPALTAALAVSGSVHYRALRQMAVDINARRLDRKGAYRLHGSISHGVVKGLADVAETGPSILGGPLGLPDLGPVALHARAHAIGTRDAISLNAVAGKLRASGGGFFDLRSRQAHLDFSVNAPAMRPRPDMAWNSLSTTGHIYGTFDSPDVVATAKIEHPSLSGFTANLLTVNIKGLQGSAALAALVQGLTIPGSQAQMFAGSPVTISASANLRAPSRPVSFVVAHPLLHVQGSATTRGKLATTITAMVPSLAPFGALAGTDLHGRANITAKLRKGSRVTSATITARVAATGTSTIDRVLGSNAEVTADTTLRGSDIQTSGKLRAAALTAGFNGTGTGPAGLDYRWKLAVTDLSRVVSTLMGSVSLEGTLKGPLNAMSLVASGNGLAWSKGYEKQAIAIDLSADGLPKPKSGNFRLSGKFDGAPIAFQGKLSRERDNLKVAIENGTWKSARVAGTVLLANLEPAGGRLRLSVNQLADFSPLLKEPLRGSLEATANISARAGHMVMRPQAVAHNVLFQDVGADRIELSGDVTGSIASPSLEVWISATNLQTEGAAVAAQATVGGPLDHLTLHASAKGNAASSPLTLSTDAVVDILKKRLTLANLNARWHDQAVALSHPTEIDWKDGVAVPDLRATVGKGQLSLAGKVLPKLALNADLRDFPAETLDLVLSDVSVAGTLSASAKLTGTLAAPEGTVTVQGAGLHMLPSPPSIPMASLSLRGTLHHDNLTIGGSLSGGRSAQLSLDGTVPLSARKPITVHAKGSADLAIVAPILTANGQSLAGRLAIDGTLTGSFARPRLAGTAQISNGELRDFTRGFWLKDIDAFVEANGTTLRLSRMTASAGEGKVTGTATVDLAAPGMPISGDLQARKAKPISSNVLTAELNADLNVSGGLQSGVNVSGTVRVLNADVTVPEKFPPSVAKLDVRRASSPPPPSQTITHDIGLDITVSSGGRVFVRGRGLDAELEGDLKIKGSSTSPDVLGAMTMRRGTLSIAGTTLDFQSGRVSFDGSGLRNRIDPTLDFVAQTSSNGITAKLNLTGYASAPKVQLTSTPNLPQDEILARLVFQQSVSQLSPFQIAEIAQALASLSGLANGFDPVGRLRRSLGLDRLAIGSTPSSTGSGSVATVEAGKYVARRVYVGAKQDMSGGTHAVVQIDITKHLKAQAAISAGTGANATSTTIPPQDNGSSVGLTYQFEY